MKLAPIPKNEGDRLKALRALCILDTPPEERFDRLTRLAQKITGTPIALVSLVDDTRQWFKSKQGVTACQTDRSISFCGHAIMEDAPFIIENALEDPRFCDNPLVLGDPNIRAYAGIPLRLPNGESAGSFCVIDTEPRPFAADQIAGLKDLAFITSEELSKVEFTENVQQLKRLTEQLQASEKRFRDVSVACGEYIWEADENGRYTFVSSPIESITGYSPERMLGRSLFEGVPEEEAAELRSVMELARKKNKAFQKLIVPYLIRPGRGNETGREPCRWIALSGIPQFDAGTSDSFIGYRGVGLDVTENKEYEEVLERAKEKAEAANHAKSAFLAMMSHEIRTPLNSVVGFTEILKTTELSSDQLEYVNSISSSSEVLLNVINDVLDFSKIEAGRLEIITKPFSIVESIQQVKTLTQAKAVEKRLSLDVTLSSNIPGRVLGDEGRLKQVLLNLVNNAIKFTERGSICIDARWKPADSEESSSYLEVIVQDTGIGISSEDQLKLFQPFTQVDSSSVRRYGGTGLGLSIVKRLCQLMGGDIYLKSESGLGSQFTFKIALKEDLTFVPTETPRNGQTKVSAGGKKSVLVVDDLPVNRKIAHYVLESLGCQVTLANDFEEAMRQLEAYACFDLVFLDIQLPGKDGYQLATEIRSWEKQHRPDGVDPLKLVALTAENPDEIRTKCLESGMDGCLGKPFKKHDFSEFL